MIIPVDIEGTVQVATAPMMLQRACDYANARVERANGPEFTQGVPLIAEWNFLRRNLGYSHYIIGNVMFLDFKHEVDRIISVSVGGEQIDNSRWNLRGSSAWNCVITGRGTWRWRQSTFQ